MTTAPDSQNRMSSTKDLLALLPPIDCTFQCSLALEMNVSYHCDRCLKLKEDGTCSKTAFGNIQTCIDHEEFPNKPGCTLILRSMQLLSQLL